jgi:hypothetical protein
MGLVLVVTWLLVPLASAQEPSPTPPVTEAPPLVGDPRPISASVEPAVEKAEAARRDPCKGVAVKGVPCFAATAEKQGRVYSVRESILGLGAEDLKGGPAPDPFGPSRNGGAGAPRVTGVTFDPGCVAKSFVKKVKGRNDVYYVYLLHSPDGDRVEMRDSRIDPATFQGNVELLGRYDGECEALAAFRAAQRQRDTGAGAEVKPDATPPAAESGPDSLPPPVPEEVPPPR